MWYSEAVQDSETKQTTNPCALKLSRVMEETQKASQKRCKSGLEGVGVQI